MWGNIGIDISLFLCYERAAESSVQWFVILKRWFRWPWFFVAHFEFCFLYGILLWALISCGILFWAMIFARGRGSSLSYVSLYLLWTYLDFSRPVCRSCFSQKRMIFGALWLKSGNRMPDRSDGVLSYRATLVRISYEFPYFSQSSSGCKFYGWKTIIAYWRCVLQPP